MLDGSSHGLVVVEERFPNLGDIVLLLINSDALYMLIQGFE